jgi:arsenate reductase-like glutaredoxin family protein
MDPEKQATLKDEDSAVSLMLENTSMIRRPIIDTGKMLIFGIDENSILESI